MRSYTDDPIADADAYDMQQGRELEKLPKCHWCGEPIQDEYCYELDTNLICENCMSQQRKSVEEAMGWGW